MEIPIIKINANSNATESLPKVKNCILKLLPIVPPLKISSEIVKGGYGNPISILRFTLTDKNVNLNVITHIASRLSDFDKQDISENFGSRISPKGEFFLRFSKHDLANNNVSLTTQSDSIRIQIKISNHNRKLDTHKNFKELQEFLSGIGLIKR